MMNYVMDSCSKKRNISIDIIRSFAILLVILGHTIAGIAFDYESSFFFQFIWTLQMPLFFLISGFLGNYSKPAENIKELLKKLTKKTLSYMLPFTIWTFLIRGLVLGRNSFLNIPYFIRHLDSGYWFLFVLWIIVILVEIIKFVLKKLFKGSKLILSFILFVSFLALFEGAFVLLGLIIGFDFFGIKLVCYYLPFYVLGYVFCILKPYFEKIKFYNIASTIIASVLGLLWIFLISKYNFYSMDDSGFNIILRVVCSICGSTFIIYILTGISKYLPRLLKTILLWIGTHTLELYLVHYLLLNIIKNTSGPLPLVSLEGFGIVMLNYLLTILISSILIWCLEKNIYISKLLFWK